MPSAPMAPVLILALLTLLVKVLLDLYLATRSGFLLRATGDNPTLVATLAKDSGKVKILGLSIANALVALSGCIMCQYQRYFDVSMGTGTLVLAVASVIVGTPDHARPSLSARHIGRGARLRALQGLCGAGAQHGPVAV